MFVWLSQLTYELLCLLCLQFVSDDMNVPAAYRQKDVFYFAYVPKLYIFYGFLLLCG